MASVHSTTPRRETRNVPKVNSMQKSSATGRVFYGWWIVVAAFLNLFFTVGLIYYGFPVIYSPLIDSLGFTRAQVSQGFLLGFAVVAPLFGLFAGALIDRVGPRQVILAGIGFVGLSLVLMGRMSRLWHYELLCVAEVVGYVLAGPIPNQVLISNWFEAKRGRAMGYAYLGLGLGGAASAPLFHKLIEHFGWRSALEIVGTAILVVLLPVGLWVTRSSPGERQLIRDGLTVPTSVRPDAPPQGGEVRRAMCAANFWKIVLGTTLTLFAIGTVSQHFILFLEDLGYARGQASLRSSVLLISSLAGRIIVGHFADRFSKKNVMALFYLVLALAIPLLFPAQHPAAVWGFAMLFGFAMGADYMLIPLITAECFGLAALGRLLSVIIMTYSIAQFAGPVLAGKIFEVTHTYNLAWGIMTVAGVAGALAIYSIRPAQAGGRPRLLNQTGEEKP